MTQIQTSIQMEDNPFNDIDEDCNGVPAYLVDFGDGLQNGNLNLQIQTTSPLGAESSLKVDEYWWYLCNATGSWQPLWRQW